MIMEPLYTINMQATGKNLKALRVKNKFSVKDLQDYFGFPYPQAIYKWEWGQCLPELQNLICLSRLYHVSVDDLIILNKPVISYAA